MSLPLLLLPCTANRQKQIVKTMLFTSKFIIVFPAHNVHVSGQELHYIEQVADVIKFVGLGHRGQGGVGGAALSDGAAHPFKETWDVQNKS